MKPRCPGTKVNGHFTSFICVLDDGHDGFCEPYVPPSVDEWRARVEWEDEVVVSLERIQMLVHRIDDARVSFRQECMELRASAAEDVETIQMARAEIVRLQAENDALRAILASGCNACAHAAPKHPVSQEATLAEMRGALDDDDDRPFTEEERAANVAWLTSIIGEPLTGDIIVEPQDGGTLYLVRAPPGDVARELLGEVLASACIVTPDGRRIPLTLAPPTTP